MIPGLTLEIIGASNISDVSAEAQRIADQLGRSVGFTFNSVRCVSVPGGDAEKLAEMQQEAQRSRFVVHSDTVKIETEVEDCR